MIRTKKIIKVSVVGIITNLALTIFKAFLGIITGSIAISVDALNNLTDAISSLITIIGTKLASKQADYEHPYGHGRIEYFTSVVIGIIIFVVGVTAFKESVVKIIAKSEITYTYITFIILSLTIITKYCLSKYFVKSGNNLNSLSLIASGKDALVDVFISLSTLISALINYFFHISIEGYIGLIIALFIIKTAYGVVKDTINYIIGNRVDYTLIKKIREMVSSYPEVLGVYDLVFHNYGPNIIIGTFNIGVRDDMMAREIHILTKKIIYDIYHDFGVNVTIGVYALNDKKKYLKIENNLKEIVKKYREIKEVHGFFVDYENNTIYFDLTVDFSCRDKRKIKDLVISDLNSKYPKYKYYVVIDNDMSD